MMETLQTELMRLRFKRTHSQHQFAVQLGVEPAPRSGRLSWEHQRLLIHAAKTALAAALCWWLAMRFGLHDGYWGSISGIIVLQSDVGSTVGASRERLLGTLIGAVLGFSFSLFGPLIVSYILALLAAVLISGLLGFRNSSRLACVTITIIMLVHQQGPRWGLAMDRVGEVLLGIIVALAVTAFVFPDRARIRLRDGLAQEFLMLGGLFEAILGGFRGSQSPDLQSRRDDLQALLATNETLLASARNEPSGGPGWREGLGMLSQFGRSIFDALLALQFAVEGSREDGFALQLEPALGHLAMDIHSGFHHVAGCIHKWQFSAAPQHINLEQDIADLEARMDAVRHTGIGFSQNEILRAYAVQLHLKQIARLLRASRIETSQAIGEKQEQEAPAESSEPAERKSNGQ
jgi:uncharacterized membrane protein YccC